ncbi:MAG: twin-arginine translocase subunit TatC [Syntrophomonadaceae bacterium]|nr:twin-arginine translocase subunit TatC [Syntrophomonadaceae bacterium]MDD3888454.1 twin-arginine translocase subunit TatC [Syntrophomonadaceae bacterium]MDD4549207.1 twin-arginine translocase subunit TatC [Syntrophomonadaceae bacterium]
MAFKNLSPEEKQTVLGHLEDLRKSVIIMFIAIIAAAVFCFYYSEQILTLLMAPLKALNEGLIVTGVTEAFFVKLKLSFYAGFVIAFPVVVWAIWRFVKPALYPGERKYFYIVLPISIILFTGGVLFAYFGILKLILNFFIFIAGENLETMFKVDQYVSFVLAFTIPFGLVFELPVVIYFLTKLGIIRAEMLSRNRKYALLVIVILAAALTPGPDPFSQMMMAGPVYLLYEISIWVAKLAKPSKERKSKRKNKKAGDENIEPESE